MIAAIDIAVRASVVVLAALAVSAALRRRSAALRHSILAAGIVASALVAPLGRALPAWDVPSPQPIDLRKVTVDIPPPVQPMASTSPAASQAGVVENQREMPFDVMVNGLWLFGIAIAMVMMAVRFSRLARVARQATEVTEPRWIETSDRLRRQLNVRRRVLLLKSDRLGLIGTYGWQRPRVLLPPDCDSWSDERIRIVLGHELAHIGRGDWIVHVASNAVRAVFWYNPLFWIACARLRAESEQACDQAILDAGVPATDYASHLLAIARVGRPLGGGALVQMARPSTLERRIAVMLNTTVADRRPTRRALAIALVAIAGITAATASFRAAAQTGPRPLTGTVYDMTGAVLPQVAVTLTHDGGPQQSSTTDRFGRFDFGVTAPGRYFLRADLVGFQGMGMPVVLQEPNHWDRTILLSVGTLQETITVTDRRPAGARPQVTTEAPVGGNLRAPAKTTDVRPIYPQALRDAGVEGVVPLGALIGTDGSVAAVRALSARANPELVRAAMDAVRLWRFTPTLLNGEAIEVYMTVTVRFSLVD